MLLHIIARGKIGRSPEAELVDRYVKRLTMPHRITEMPDRGGKLPPVQPGTITVMLDEKGRQLSSMDFARRIEGWRDAGTRECRFLIGAADGFEPSRRWCGRRHGFIFKTGARGLGYYRDAVGEPETDIVARLNAGAPSPPAAPPAAPPVAPAEASPARTNKRAREGDGEARSSKRDRK